MNQDTAAQSPSQIPHSAAGARITAPVAQKSRRKRRGLLLAGFILPSLLVAGLAGTYGAYVSWAGGELIAPNISIAGEAVGGLTKAEAQDRLAARFGRLFVTIKTNDRPFKVSLNELGGAPVIPDVVEKSYEVGRQGGFLSEFFTVYGSKTAGRRLALPVVWDKDALKQRLYIINRLYHQKPRDASLKVTADGVQIVPEQYGRALNVGECALQLQQRYYVGLPVVEAATRMVAPKVTAASLEGSDVKLAEYPTRFNPGDRGRTQNVRVAARAVSGKVIMPGEVFSFNHTTGERTAAKGYKMAHIFITKPGEDEAEVADGLAGGTCQVSSTLFNAVCRTNKKTDGALEIVERNHHSLPVTYVPPGKDATVAWPGKDFRFRNAFPNPIYLQTLVRGSHLTVSIWARVPGGDKAPLVETDTPDSDESTRLARVPVAD